MDNAMVRHNLPPFPKHANWQATKRRIDRIAIVILLIIYPVCAALLGQDSNWDQKNYHLYSALSFLQGSFDQDILPAGVQTFNNPLTSLPSLAMLYASAWVSPLWGTLLLAVAQGTGPVLVYLISKELFGNKILPAFLAAFIGSTGSLALSESGNTMGDLTLATLPLLSIYLIIRSSARSRPVTLLTVAMTSGIAGAACGLKMSSVFMVPVIFGLSIQAYLTSRSGIEGQSRLLPMKICAARISTGILAFTAGVIIFIAPLSYHSYQQTQSPIFPFFNKHFQSPLHPNQNWTDDRFMPRSTREALLAPLFSITDRYNGSYWPEAGLSTRRTEPKYSDARPLFFFISLAYLLFISCSKAHSPHLSLIILLSSLIGLSYMIFIMASGIGRYSISMELLMGIPMIAMLQCLIETRLYIKAQRSLAGIHNNLRSEKISMPDNNNRMSRLAISSFILMVIIVSLQKIPDWGRTNFIQHWTNVNGLSSTMPLINGSTPVERILDPSGDTAIVMLNQGYSFIKTMATPQTSLFLWEPNGSVNKEEVRSRIINRLSSRHYKNIILQTGDMSLEQGLQISQSFLDETGLLRNTYSLKGCSRLETHAGFGFLACQFDLKPD